LLNLVWVNKKLFLKLLINHDTSHGILINLKLFVG
jgi:hypothetical protein